MVAQVQASLANINAQVQASNKSAAAAVSSQIANPLIVQAAQLRALYSTGSIALKDLQVQQRALVSSLDQQIKLLATRNDLDNKSLATLKQLTLERERQQNALNRGVGVGVTAGTSSALSGVSGPIIANISRLSSGLLGVAGGSGGGGAAFAQTAAGITQIAAAGGVATAVVGGLAAALVIAAGAAVGLATSGGELVQDLSNISQKTGISIQNLQALKGVAEVSGTRLDDLVVGFRKFSQVLTGGGVDENGNFQTATKESTDYLRILGVTSKDSNTALLQLASGFQKLPDGATKATVAVQLLGRSGLTLIPFLNKGADGAREFLDIIKQYGGAIDQNGVQAEQNWLTATVKLNTAIDATKISALPLLNILASLKTEAADFLNVINKTPGGAVGTGFALLTLLGGGVSAPFTIFNSISGGLDKVSASSVLAGSSLDKMFKIAEDGLKGLQLQDKINAAARFNEFLKQINANAEEFEKHQTERGNSAQTLITNTLHKLPPGASESDRAVQQMNDEIDKIREGIIGLPGLAESAQAAIAKLTAETLAGLAGIESDSLEKASEAVEKILEEEATKRLTISNIIRQAQDQAAVDAAAATRNAVAQIIAEEQKRFDSLKKDLALQGATEQDFANLRVTINQDANNRIAKARQDEIDKTNKQIEQQAGQLLDALLRGGGNFTTALKNSLENLLLAPVKQIFSAVVAGIFTKPIQSAKDELTALGNNLQKQHPTGVLNSIGKSLAPKDAIGNNTDALGTNTKALINLTNRLGGGTGASGSGGSGPLGTLLDGSDGLGGLPSFTGVGPNFNPLTDALPLGDVSKELSNLTGALTGSSSASSSPNALGTQIASLVGTLTGTIPSGGGGFGNFLFGASNKVGSVLGALGLGGGKSGSGLAQFLGPGNVALGLGNLLGGIAGGNAGQAIGGGLTTLGGGLFSIGGLLGTSSSGASAVRTSFGSVGNVGATLQQVGGVLGGAGLVVSGISQGGVGGALQTTLGGAEIGTAIAPGIGTAIGAAAGLAAGLIGGLFGKKGFTQAQIDYAKRKQYIDPNTFVGQEFDRSAQATFGQTLASGFSSGPGGAFGNATITPPLQYPIYDGFGHPIAPTVIHNHINAMDPKSFAQYFRENGAAAAKVIGDHMNHTQSGLARNVRSIVNPA
jgi:hypothetical protein